MSEDRMIAAACSGFGLAAYRRDGKLYAFHDPSVEIGDNWPEELTLFGKTYTLEDSGEGDRDSDGFEWAEYA